jgi:prefoldin alpha subunit
MAHYSQNRSQALKHYEIKVDFIRTNLETLQDTIQKKQDNLNYLLSIIQSKLQAQTQASPA